MENGNVLTTEWKPGKLGPSRSPRNLNWHRVCPVWPFVPFTSAVPRLGAFNSRYEITVISLTKAVICVCIHRSNIMPLLVGCVPFSFFLMQCYEIDSLWRPLIEGEAERRKRRPLTLHHLPLSNHNTGCYRLPLFALLALMSWIISIDWFHLFQQSL